MSHIPDGGHVTANITGASIPIPPPFVYTKHSAVCSGDEPDGLAQGAGEMLGGLTMALQAA
ncbi:MAG: hypothetical protein WBE31_16120 [Candidatus Sulfotelmatobacter sp.]